MLLFKHVKEVDDPQALREILELICEAQGLKLIWNDETCNFHVGQCVVTHLEMNGHVYKESSEHGRSGVVQALFMCDSEFLYFFPILEMFDDGTKRMYHPEFLRKDR